MGKPFAFALSLSCNVFYYHTIGTSSPVRLRFETDQFPTVRNLLWSPFKTINLKPLYIGVSANAPAISNVGHSYLGQVWLWNIHASEKILLCCYLWSIKVIHGERKLSFGCTVPSTSIKCFHLNWLKIK